MNLSVSRTGIMDEIGIFYNYSHQSPGKLFWKIVDGKMQLSQAGVIADVLRVEIKTIQKC